jgi:hypothetical protein
MQPNEIIDRALGIAFGTAVGDAMGIPFENLSPKGIAEILMSVNKDESLFVNAAGRNPYIPKEWAKVDGEMRHSSLSRSCMPLPNILVMVLKSYH